MDQAGYWDLPSLVAQKVTGVKSLGQEDPLEKEMAIHSSILAGESHGQRRLVGYSPWGHKELDMTEVAEHTHMHAFF